MASADPPPDPPQETVPVRDWLPPDSLSAPPPFRRGWPWLAWAVIVLAVGVLAVGSTRNVQADPAPARSLTSKGGDLTFRYLVGLKHLLGPLGGDVYAQAQGHFAGGPDQQLRLVVFAGETRDAREALAVVQRLESAERSAWSDQQERVLAVLRQVYRDYEQQRWAAPSVGEAERQLLREELGWAGRLALHPQQSPAADTRAELMSEAALTVGVLIGVGLWFMVLSLAGALSLVLLLVLVWLGRVRSRLGPASGTGGLYAETFALWVLLYPALGLLFGWLALPGPRLLTVGLLPQVLSLSVLAWPVLWGVPWKQVRAEIGLTTGRLGWVESIFGLGTYVLAVPLYLSGAGLTFLLLLLQRWLQGVPEGTEAIPISPHPIVETVGRSSWPELLLIALLASVMAPLLEEILFRGVLYRQLREASGRWRTVVSVFVSACVVGFIFAVIHPYGLLGVPPLMGLSFAFTIAREWRGTLLPAMVAHGIQNTFALLMARFLLGG